MLLRLAELLCQLPLSAARHGTYRLLEGDELINFSVTVDKRYRLVVLQVFEVRCPHFINHVHIHTSTCMNDVAKLVGPLDSPILVVDNHSVR